MPIFTNQATLSYNDNVTNSNVVTGELLEVLSVTKTATDTDYRPGDVVTYIVSIVNSGAAPFNNLTVTDNLGAYTFPNGTLTPLSYVTGSVKYFINGVLQTAPAVTAGPPLQFTGITVPASGNAMLIYETTVNHFAPAGTGGTLTNTVTVSGETLFSDVTDSETINAASEAQLTISKSLSPESVTDNSQLTYTFVIQNLGTAPAVATDNVVVTDIFNPILNPITVTFNGTTWTSPTNYTYDPETGTFQTVAGQITVPAATYTQDPTNGQWIVTPGVAILRVTGTV